jgi:phenylpyruvate tautomerase PptA (4-oxalocrotonate tautomerase family)
MTMIDRTSNDVDALASAGIDRRAMLISAAVAASAATGLAPGLADPAPSAGFGAPLVELQVPAGVLTLEQKAAMIKGITDVVFNATKLPPGPAARISFVQIIETAEGGFGVNGQVFVPRGK